MIAIMTIVIPVIMIQTTTIAIERHLPFSPHSSRDILNRREDFFATLVILCG
jgi:hypothetical protein